MKEHDPYLRYGPVRWPPRVAASLQYGLLAYFGVLHYIQGMNAEEIGMYVADGYMEFWQPLGHAGLAIGASLLIVAILWILYDNWRQLGKFAA